MEKKITIELTEGELNSIIHCLNTRVIESDAAPEWKIEYQRLANELENKRN